MGPFPHPSVNCWVYLRVFNGRVIGLGEGPLSLLENELTEATGHGFSSHPSLASGRVSIHALTGAGDWWWIGNLCVCYIDQCHRGEGEGDDDNENAALVLRRVWRRNPRTGEEAERPKSRLPD